MSLVPGVGTASPPQHRDRSVNHACTHSARRHLWRAGAGSPAVPRENQGPEVTGRLSTAPSPLPGPRPGLDFCSCALLCSRALMKLRSSVLRACPEGSFGAPALPEPSHVQGRLASASTWHGAAAAGRPRAPSPSRRPLPQGSAAHSQVLPSCSRPVGLQSAGPTEPLPADPRASCSFEVSFGHCLDRGSSHPAYSQPRIFLGTSECPNADPSPSTLTSSGVSDDTEG